MNRARLTSFLCWSAMAAALSWPATRGAAAGTPTQSEEAAGEEPARAAAAPESALLARMWWNRPKLINALGLRPEQRVRMDQLLLENRAAVVDAWKTGRDRGKAYRQALLNGDWQSARVAAADLRAALSRRGAAEAEITIGAISLLEDKQRRELIEKYPQALQLWPGRHVGWRSGQVRGPRERATASR